MTGAGIGRPRLALLVAGVLAAHLVLLGAGPATVHAPAPEAVQSLSTRAMLIVSASQPATSLPSPESSPQPTLKPTFTPPPTVPLRSTPQLAATHPPPATTAVMTRDPAAHSAAGAPQHPRADLTTPPPATAAAEPAPSRQVTPPPMSAVSVAAPVRLRYQVAAHSRGQTWHGHGELQFRHDGQTYEATLAVSAALLRTRTQRSTGRITAEGLAPLRFSDKGRQEEAAHFQREQARLSFSNNRPDAELSPGAQDRLSVLLQLGALIAANPTRFTAGTTIAIQTANTREAEPWLFTVQGPQALDLPGGKAQALKLIRLPRKEFDQQVELWLAPAMHYLPVRLRLTQTNGDWVEQRWTATEPN